MVIFDGVMAGAGQFWVVVDGVLATGRLADDDDDRGGGVVAKMITIHDDGKEREISRWLSAVLCSPTRLKGHARSCTPEDQVLPACHPR